MKYSLLLTLTIVFTIFSSRAAVDFPAQSALSSGKWIKVRVDSTGVQRISYEKLRAWGFAHPEKVAVRGFGSVEMSLEFPQHPVDLPQVQVAHDNNALFFYGEGETRFEVESAKSVSVVTNRYSRGSYYFLSEDDDAAEMTVVPYVENHDAPQMDTHTSLSACYPREFNPATGGAWWYSRNITEADPYSVTLSLPGYSSNGYMGYKAIGKHTEVNYMLPEVTASGGIQFTPAEANRIYRSTNEKEAYRPMSKYNVAQFKPDEGVNKVTFTLSPDRATDVSLMCLDNMWITYSRDNILDDACPALSMYFTPHKGGDAIIRTAKGNAMVWDVTDVHNVTRLATESVDGGFMFNLPSRSETRKIEAFYPAASSLKEPAYEGPVDNTSLHSIKGGYDMVIIAAPDFVPAARRLADAHASRQGLEVLVASKEDVLHEFGSGSFTPNSVRLFIKMLRDRDSRLRYVLLIGAGFFDNSAVASATNVYLPTYQAELQSNAYNIAKAYTSDSFYGYMEDEIAPDISTRVDNVTPRVIDIAVGRFPAFSVTEAELLVDKAIAYLDNPALGGDPARVMMMADKGNENQHALGAQDASAEMLSAFPGLTVSRCYDAAYVNPNPGATNSTLVKHISAGFASNPALITYAGHSSRGSLFSESIITRSFFDGIQFGSASLFLSASCHPYMLDYEYRGLISDLLLRREGGSTFIIGPAREVYLKNNQAFCNEFARRYYDMTNRTIGDVYRSAMSAMQEEGQSVRTNALSYNLGGDPALPLPRIDARVTLDGDKVLTLTPCRRTRISGEILDNEGALCADFNGSLNIKIFDVPRTFLSYANVNSDLEDRFMLTLDETVIAETDCKVAGGKWETYITVPAVANDNGINRMAMFARPESGFSMAAGFSTDVTIAAYDPDGVTPDTEAPEIEISIEDVLADGTRVETSRTPSITVRVSDTGSGVSKNNSTVGSAMSILLDGNISVANVDRMLRPDDNGGYTVTVTPQALNDGRHTITVKASDNAGNTASRELDFYVVEEAFACSLGMESDVVKSSATFTLNHPLADTPDARIVVEDLHGRHIMSRTVTGDSFEWDLRDDAGKPVKDGSYRVYAVVSRHPRYSSTKPLKFTVIR
ncbi:MAG: hypothetical protein K2K47_07515 [Duncaniella sp.]|nr:hypothetical protein [Duncaniella sp.]